MSICLALSDRVYLAVGQWPKQIKNVKKLCRRLGLGLLVVAPRARRRRARSRALQAADQNKHKADRMLGEHAAASAIPTSAADARAADDGLSPGGAALRGAAREQRADEAGGVACFRRRAERGRILRDDVYGWFERVERGVYTLTPAGRRGIGEYVGAPATPSEARGP